MARDYRCSGTASDQDASRRSTHPRTGSQPHSPFTARLDDSTTDLAAPITEIDLPGFEEGVHERDGWFYLCYGYRHPQRVGYARSRSLDGPWTFEGIVNGVPGNRATNRPAIVEFAGEWFFFYHNGALPGGGSHRRSVCVDRLGYTDDGRIRRVHMTTEGVLEAADQRQV